MAGAAFADQLSYTLHVSHPDLAPTNSAAHGGYRTVTLTLQDSTHIKFDVVSFNGVPTGSATSTDYKISDFGFNPSSTLVFTTLTCSSVTAGWSSGCTGSGNLDGMGSYAFQVTGPN